MNINVLMAELFTYFATIAIGLLPVFLVFLMNVAAKYADKLHNQNIKDLVLTTVQAAQQSIPDKSARYDKVAGFVQNKYPAIPAEQIKLLIESAVHIIKSQTVILPPAVESVTLPSVPVAPLPTFTGTIQP